ncbi:MAG TPA: phosphoribosyltransferase family protein [Dictyobacter sp.]|nr:phosphoribosyltransferase family protein [Dictyobacter sp.]
MNDPEIMKMFADAQAIITDNHFVYTSGRHSSAYVNKDAVYMHTETVRQLGERMARPFNADEIDVVVGPVIGGVVLSQWVSHFLNQRRISGETMAVFAEKGSDGVDKQFTFNRGYDQVIAGKNVLVVEDVLTTGGSARQVIEVVRQYGGHVVALSALCNRGNVQPADIGGAPLHTLINLSLETYAEEDCPFCKQGVPVNTQLGKGKAFLARKQKA